GGVGASAWQMTRLALFPHRFAAPPSMDMADMNGRTQALVWSPRSWLLAVAMWWTMMVAMMAPSAVFAAGYLFVWLLFSVVATGLQALLQASALVSPALMGSTSRWLSA